MVDVAFGQVLIDVCAKYFEFGRREAIHRLEWGCFARKEVDGEVIGAVWWKGANGSVAGLVDDV